MARAAAAAVAFLLLFALAAASSCPPKKPKPFRKPPAVVPPPVVNPPVVVTPTLPPRQFPPTYPFYGPKCPVDTLKLAACANLLGGLVSAIIGTPPTTPCCSLIGGLADLEAAACLCTAIKANILGINLNVPVSLSLLVNACGRRLPAGFQCP